MENLEEILRAKVEAVDAMAAALKERIENGTIDNTTQAQEFVDAWAEAMASLLTTNR